MDISQNLPKSPVTGSENVRLADTFSVTDIVRLYKEQENLDVKNYFGHGDKLYLYECLDVGYRFYYPFETIGGEQFYQDIEREVEKRGSEYDRDWDEDHQFGFNQIGLEEHVLEIGCNSGKFLKRVTEKSKNVIGLDFNPSALAKAANRGVNAIDESIEVHAERRAGEYDVVCAFQVFEHLMRIGTVMAAILKALKPGGKLVLSVPNNEPYFQRFNKYEVMNMPPHHVGLWNLEAFKRMATHFDMNFVQHYYYGRRGLLPDAYLRSKLMAGVRSLPIRHTILDKLKMLAAVPVALPLSSYDFAFRGVKNYANLSVVLQKK